MRTGPLSVLGCVLLMGCDMREPVEHGEAVWGTLPNAYAEHFQVQVRGTDRRILVFGPGGVRDTVGCYMLMGTPAGQEMPVAVPLQRVAVVSTTHLPFFTALGVPEAVVGVAHADAIRDRGLRERVRSGAISEITRAEGLDRERLIALAPQALFDYPFGRKPGQVVVVPTTIAVTEYLEEHPLGRAEWIRFFGLLLGKEKRADSSFAALSHRYTTLRDMRRVLGEQPRVLFGSNWEKDWFAPPGNSYMAALIHDAGGRYWFADSTSDGNIPMAIEQVIGIADSCDHFGVVMAEDGRVDALRMAAGDPRVAGLKALRNGGFIGNSARSDLFGQALLEPEVALQDLRCIFHPGTCSGHRPTYFFPIGQ